ncbi:MAG: hypothetical protein H0V88_14665 [Pyrinomonadaceae bacterium]|nr:hypothetical protein [Pyrinomonadaceae bacterium]
MNVDFEAELSCAVSAYRRLPSFNALIHRLASHLLWLARPGDALLLPESWPEYLQSEARRRGVELLSPTRAEPQRGYKSERVWL